MKYSRTFATKSLPPKQTAFGLVMVGAILLAGAAYLAVSTFQFQKTGIRTIGVVTKVERGESSIFPVFEFMDNDGRLVEIRSSTSSKDYLPGDRIRIIFDPERPLDARIDSQAALYILPIIFSIIGLSFLGGALVLVKFLPMFEAAYDKDRALKEAGH